jgi:hypothetical protein
MSATAATVKAPASTVEAAALDSATCGTMKAADGPAMKTSNRTARVAASAVVAASVAVAATVAPAGATIVAASPTPTAASPISVIPRAGADEYAASEPVRTVVAIRRASVRVISVVAVRANRSRANSYAHRDLGLRVG